MTETTVNVNADSESVQGPMMPTYAELMERAQKAERDANSLSEAQKNQARIIARYRDDVKVLGEALTEAANDNDLCEIYDNVIESVNADMSVIELPARSKAQSTHIYRIDIAANKVAGVDQDLEDLDADLTQVAEAAIQDYLADLGFEDIEIS